MAGYRVFVLETADIVVVGTGAVADNQCRKTGSPPAAAIVDMSMQKYRGSGHAQGQTELRSRTGCCYQLGSRYTCPSMKIMDSQTYSRTSTRILQMFDRV